MSRTKISKAIGFSELFDNPTFSDFHFEFDGNHEYLYCHKVILNQNEFFKSLFRTNTLEVNENKMKINDDPKIFSLLIKSLYIPDLELNFESYNELLPIILLADKYQFLIARDQCCNLLLHSITKENCALVWLFSDGKEYLSSVNKKAAKVLKRNYFGENMEVVKDELNGMVNDFNVEEMILFIETFVTSVTNTDVLLSIIVKWAECDQQARGSRVLNILQTLEGKKNAPYPVSDVVWLENESKKINPRSYIKGRETTLFGSERFTPYQKVQFSIAVKIYKDKLIENVRGLIIGIATDNQSRKTWLGKDHNGYGFLPFSGEKIHYNNASRYSSKILSTEDDAKMVTVNLPGDGSVEFLINGQSLGIAFENLPRNVAFRPAASFLDNVAINLLEFG